jgi:hypothetical protein
MRGSGLSSFTNTNWASRGHFEVAIGNVKITNYNSNYVKHTHKCIYIYVYIYIYMCGSSNRLFSVKTS